MANTGDGLKLLLGLGRRSPDQHASGSQGHVAVYVHDLERDQKLVGLRVPGVHAYVYRLAPAEDPGSPDKK